MKNRIINIISIFFVTIIIMFIALESDVLAASLTLTSSKTITVGETQSITIGSGVTGRVDITSSDPSVVSISTSRLWIENGSASVSITAKKEGSATITVKASSLASSEDGSKVTGEKKCNVIVKAKQKPIEQKPETPTKTPTTNKTTTTKTENKKTEKAKEKVVETKEKEEATPELGIHSLKLIGIKENGEEVEVSLDKEFNIKTFDYTCNVENDIKILKIEKEAYEYNDLVQISGLDEELKIGENTITLKLSNKGKDVIYTIKVIKEEKLETDETSLISAEPEERKEIVVSIPLIWFILLEVLIVTISVGITVFIMNYLKLRRTQE